MLKGRGSATAMVGLSLQYCDGMAKTDQEGIFYPGLYSLPCFAVGRRHIMTLAVICRVSE